MKRLNVNFSTAERRIVLEVLDPSNTGQISSLRWNEFLKGFGPLSQCLFNLQDMLSKPYVWFVFAAAAAAATAAAAAV